MWNPAMQSPRPLFQNADTQMQSGKRSRVGRGADWASKHCDARKHGMHLPTGPAFYSCKSTHSHIKGMETSRIIFNLKEQFFLVVY